ncbi:hypothetical protein PEX1_011090 [Penicillium expansum]|uniref:Uncharacterized protein n=1 Tax=Penicillium expansum TaxID=27334 RepID=A0A0A2K528_PENEN|nr:hypothetical protein PEX2_043700 [Penicillium expansum]KGO45655.1 hypothetical protein PEXP_062530 [Penicillium expansum]KGO62847.1 hypothetical protein PEX2_043700 [Penicillium expansum]KGO70642.1 hypothetical protein PEX1_011090 [Penicillium expansum]
MSFFANPRPGGRHGADPEIPSAPRTQATNLPKETSTTLLNITKLRPDSSLTVWGNEIIHVLQPFQLDALVDYDLPRPHIGDPNYNRWKFWTLVVANWLFNQVDASLQLKVKAHSNDLTFADEIFNTIRLLSLHSQSKFLAKELKRWEELKRDEFSTPADFIMAYQNQFNRLKTEGHEPSCDVALVRLLQELHGEVLKVPFIQEEIRDLERPVDYQLFVYYCKVLVAESRKPTVSPTENTSMGIYGEARGRSQSSGRDISYRGWRQSTKGRGPAWE